MQDVIRVGIVDDHPLYREGVAATLAACADFEIVAQGATADEAVRIARDMSPQLLLLDIGLPGNGLRAAQRITENHPEISVVLLTVAEDEETVKSALASGVSGYIVKGVGGYELANALRSVHSGARYVSPSLAARIIAQKPSMSPARAGDVLTGLTGRETEIARQVARGLTNKEVARALLLSEKTVKHHMTRIMHKLGIRNRMELVLMASVKAGDQGAHDVVANGPDTLP